MTSLIIADMLVNNRQLVRQGVTASCNGQYPRSRVTVLMGPSLLDPRLTYSMGKRQFVSEANAIQLQGVPPVAALLNVLDMYPVWEDVTRNISYLGELQRRQLLTYTPISGSAAIIGGWDPHRTLTV